MRVGRTAAPSFLLSDSRFVGYAQPWIRPPVEVYGVLPITSNDGIDVSWRRSFGTVANTFQAYYGRASAKLETATAKARPAWGLNNAVQLGDLTLRAGYTYNDVDIDFPGVDALLGGISAFGAIPGPIGAQARALANRYATRGIELSAYSLAASSRDLARRGRRPVPGQDPGADAAGPARQLALYGEFYRKATGRDIAQVKAAWARLVFSGKAQAPRQLPDAAAVRKAVAADPKAIGYIEKGAVDSSVKVLLSLD